MYKLQSIIEGSWGRNSSRNLKQRPWGTLFAASFATSCLAGFLLHARTSYPDFSATHSELGLTTSVDNEGSSTQTCPQVNLI